MPCHLYFAHIFIVLARAAATTGTEALRVTLWRGVRVPHRIGHVQRTFEEILSRDGVVAWDGSKILDWYLAQQRQRG
jgi:hypothetical protein